MTDLENKRDDVRCCIVRFFHNTDNKRVGVSAPCVVARQSDVTVILYEDKFRIEDHTSTTRVNMDLKETFTTLTKHCREHEEAKELNKLNKLIELFASMDIYDDAMYGDQCAGCEVPKDKC